MIAHRGKFVAYFRISTDRQGKSGLGLEPQREAVLAYLDGGNWTMVAEFTEVESGKRTDRPQLAAALVACKKHKAKLVIAKLDRLSRKNGKSARGGAVTARPTRWRQLFYASTLGICDASKCLA